jgi:hypothetical protein
MALSNQIRVQVLIKEFVPEIGHEYCDALYYSPEDYFSLTQDDVDREMYKRIANWVDAVKNPPVQPEPTKEELQAEEASILEQKAMLDARVSEIQVKKAEIDTKPVKDIKGK